VRRCLAIGQAASAWADVELLVAGDEAVLPLAADAGVPAALVPADFDVTLDRIRAAAADALVVDSYAIGHDALRAACALTRVVALDDHGRFPVPADLVVNPAAGLTPPSGDGRYLLGPRFAPLARDFETAPTRTTSEHVAAVLIVLGGATPAALAAGVARAVHRAVPAAIRHVIVGLVGAASEDIARALGGVTGVVFHRAPRAMRELMATSDLAVAAGGVTLLVIFLTLLVLFVFLPMST
jgi:spore coat polysaccharide biosynthesis predicted glycosyltransferase SpsG